jgi:hypothetical protein
MPSPAGIIARHRMKDPMKLPALIAIINNPTACPPGHTIKEFRPPHVPVASVPCNPYGTVEVRAKSVALAHAMAAAPEMLAALRLAQMWLDPKKQRERDAIIAIQAAIAKAEGR